MIPYVNPIAYLSNLRGIPRIETTGVSVNGTTNVHYTIDAKNMFSDRFSGLILVKIDQAIPSGTTGTLPVVFSSGLGIQPIITYGLAPLTVAQMQGPGIYLMYYDRANNTLTAITGVLPATTTTDGTTTGGGTATGGDDTTTTT